MARILLGFGVRIQKSVFQVELEPDDLPDLQRSVGSLLSAEDRFDLLPVDLQPARPRLSWQNAPAGSAAVIVL